MRKLYTAHVLPDGLIALWNNGIRDLCHVLPAGQDPVEERPRLVAAFATWIVQNCLHVDTNPTLSRFFTFRDCTDRMLTMELIGMPSHAFQVRSVVPRKENQKRLKNVVHFYGHGEASQLLRRTNLTFQLTGGVEALVSEVPKPGQPPPMVRLCQHAATHIVEDRLQRVLGCMADSDDPSLDIGAATNTLLALSMELVIRMRLFTGYPAALCRMSEKWFGKDSLANVSVFLATNRLQLDVGAELQIFEVAWGRGSEAAANAWLLSEPVQDMLDKLAEIVFANSLEAERRHAQVKQWESSKLTHVSTASRNAITTRFLRRRQQQVDLIEASGRALQKQVRTNVQALAWAQPMAFAMRPAGVKWSASRQPSTIAADEPAVTAAGSMQLATFGGRF